MKYVFAALVAIVSSIQFASAGDTYVHGYTKQDGTVVQGYHRTTSDDTINNNYGTKGNVNPWTGQSGHVPRNNLQPNGEYNMGNGLGTQPKKQINTFGSPALDE